MAHFLKKQFQTHFLKITVHWKSTAMCLLIKKLQLNQWAERL